MADRGVSRTFIGPNGKKIGKAWALGSPLGIIRLSADEDVGEGLHIAEGKESALAAMALGLRPVWAMGSDKTMAKFPVLAGVGCLTILADHDASGAGERAARQVERRWLEAGRKVRIFMRNEPGDINNALKAAAPEVWGESRGSFGGHRHARAAARRGAAAGDRALAP